LVEFGGFSLFFGVFPSILRQSLLFYGSSPFILLLIEPYLFIRY